MANKIRKLSVTLTLSEGTDYIGGDLEMDLRNNDCGRDIHQEQLQQPIVDAARMIPSRNHGK